MQDFLNIPNDIKNEIILFHSGTITEIEANKLLSWVNATTENKKLFDDITEIWHASSILNPTSDIDIHKEWENVKKRLINKNETSLPKNNKFSIIYKIAASVTILFAIGSGWIYTYYHKPIEKNKDKYIEMSAPLGSRINLKLIDGTQVWLNSGSHLKVPGSFGDKTRDVILTGEAYFSVAKNKNKPFIVHTSEVNITALGTAFNVKAYNDEQNIETTLEEGSVKIEPNKLIRKNQVPLLLSPNQRAIYQRKNADLYLSTNIKSVSPAINRKIEKNDSKIVPLKILKVEDLRAITSWKDERWIIKQELFGELVRKLERRYDIQVNFDDQEIKEFSFTGSLQNESIEQVLNIIKLTAPIEYTLTHKTVTLRINKKMKNYYKDLLRKE